jgi:hypothetical protein
MKAGGSEGRLLLDAQAVQRMQSEPVYRRILGIDIEQFTG